MSASKRSTVCIDHHPAVGHVAATMLRQRLDTVWTELHAVCVMSGDADHVHALRVATRRALAAVDAFRSVIPAKRRTWFEKRLRRLRRTAGEARDLAVLIERLGTNRAVGPRRRLVAMLSRRHRLSREPICAQRTKLKKADWSCRVDRLIEAVHDRRRRTGFRAFARRRFKPMVASFVDAADRSTRDNHDIHELRIEGKKLRYAMEIFAGVFPAGIRGRCQKSLERLQDLLGECTDHAAAADRLYRWSRSATAGLDRDMLVALSDEENKKANRARKTFCKWWNPARRRSLSQNLDRAVRDSA
jgi:CHAD domain-containing protein